MTINEARKDTGLQSGRRGGENASDSHAIRDGDDNILSNFSRSKHHIGTYHSKDKDGNYTSVDIHHHGGDHEHSVVAIHGKVFNVSKGAQTRDASDEEKSNLKKAIPDIKKAIATNDHREVAKAISKHTGREFVAPGKGVNWFERLSKAAQEKYLQKHRSRKGLVSKAGDAAAKRNPPE